jgi:DNA-binding MarR family transcriptional regulator
MQTKTYPTAIDCACELLEVVPMIMRHIRLEMRRSRGSDLTVPQFRTLAYLTSHDGASLSDLADHIGLTLPSTSKLVDGLVERKFVHRKMCADDRRRMTLTLTGNGRAAWSTAYQAAQSYLAGKMAAVSQVDQDAIKHALTILRPIFQAE